MNKHFSKAALAAALVLASTGVMAADGSFFVNAELGASHYDITNSSDTTGSAYAGRLGYMWHLNGVDVGVEGGYADLGKVTHDDYYYGVHEQAKVHGSLLGADVRLPMGSQWFLSARGGWFHSSTDADATNGVQTASASVDGDGSYFGIGFGFDFNTHASLAFDFDNYQSKAEGIFTKRFNTGFYGASFEYRF